MTEPLGKLFTPQADITTYELACIVQELLSSQKSVFLQPLMAQMPEPCKRHFIDYQPITKEAMLYITSSKA